MKKVDENGNPIRNENGEIILEEAYSVATGTVLTINTRTKKLYKDGEELIDISKALTPQKLEFIKAGGSYAIVFGKKIQTIAAQILGIEIPNVFAPSKEMQLRKYLTEMPLDLRQAKFCTQAQMSGLKLILLDLRILLA